MEDGIIFSPSAKVELIRVQRSWWAYSKGALLNAQVSPYKGIIHCKENTPKEWDQIFAAIKEIWKEYCSVRNGGSSC